MGCAWRFQGLFLKLSTRSAAWPRSTSPGSAATSTSGCWTRAARAWRPGDWVLIHVGFAISKVDEEEAVATRRLLEGMGAEYEQELEELKASAIE